MAHSCNPALLLHGVPTAGALWDAVRAALPEKRHCLAPDLPGHGAEPPLSRPTVEAHLDWLEGWRQGLALPAWSGLHLVGTDYGGLLAACIASRQGARSLTLCSTALGPGWLPARLMALPVLERLFYRRHGGRLWLRHAVGEAQQEAFLSTFGGRAGAPDLARQMRETARGIPLGLLARLPGQLARSGVPNLLLWGDADRYYPLAAARFHQRRLPRARLEVLPGARHAAMWEQPGPFARALEGFWQEAEGG